MEVHNSNNMPDILKKQNFQAKYPERVIRKSLNADYRFLETPTVFPLRPVVLVC